MLERIQKILSSNGVSSRRTAEQMIIDGRVTVNGIRATIGQSAQVDVDCIEIDGVALVPQSAHVYIMLNKPRGYVTTMSDEHDRKTVIDLLNGVDIRIYPIGRLDINTSGLLFLTNDGRFANIVMHPSYSITKTYEAHVIGQVDKAEDILRLPIEIDGYIVHAVTVSVKKRTSSGGILEIAVSEGRNRQVRKMCEHAGLKVRALKRISIGSVTLGALKTGQWRHLTPDERQSLFDAEN
jgi:23S rRNA pseudouridine2605 synthase